MVLGQRHAIEFQPVVNETIAQLLCNKPLQLLDLVVVELDDPACLHVDQMVMMLVRHFLVAGTTVTKIVPDNERIRAALETGTLPFARIVPKEPYLKVS